MSVSKVCGCFNPGTLSPEKKEANMPSPRLQAYMDDLFDALLADLQSTTLHIQDIQQQQLREQQQQQPDSRESTPPPPPLPPHPTETTHSSSLQTASTPSHHHPDRGAGEMYEYGESLYETQVIKPQRQNVVSSVATKSNKPVAAVPMAMRQNAPQRSALSNNLSELDTLLQDLDSAQFIAEVDRRNSGTANGFHGREEVITPKTAPPRDRTMDSMLEELNRQEDLPNHYEQVNIHNPPPHTAQHIPPHMSAAAAAARQPAASSATRELDDLMASLSEFKMSTPPAHVGEPPYAQSSKVTRPQQPLPQQSQTTIHDGMNRAPAHTANAMQASPAGSVGSGGGGGAAHQGNNLEAMLGNLSTDMSKQGIMTVPKGHCAACSKPIVGQVITALGRIWHPEHFVCSHCKSELGTNNFFERDGNPFCERDYHLLFSPRCASCNGPILDKCITALDKSWHPEHFICAHCKRPFGEDGFHEKDGLAYCRDDYFDMFAPKCGGCSRPIMDNYISALNKQWHPECFVCYECHMPFGASSFFDHDGFPFCETHYHARRGSLCAGCQKPITGRCITAMYKKFHPEHFVCAFCLKQLNKGTFKEQKDKPYCHPCFVKLFG